MKAILVRQFGNPDVMTLEDAADPVAGDGEVVVRLRAAGVNPVDAYVRTGTYAIKPDLPYTPGMDAAGTVELVGPNVVEIKAGDRVWVSATEAGKLQGAYAEKALCKAKNVHPLPDGLSFAQGAAVNVAYVTAYRALFDRAKLQPGEVVLVHGGTGGVGLATIQQAALHGAIVLATGGTPEGRQLAKDSGAAHVFDHKSPSYRDEILKATGGKGVNVVVEMLANVNLDHDLGLVGPGGRIVIIGSRGRVEIDPRQLFGKESTITALTYWSAGDAAVQHAIAAVSAGLHSGALKPVVGQSFPLADAAKAHEAVLSGNGAGGKIVLEM
jgi:NADPH:quinone reductase